MTDTKREHQVFDKKYWCQSFDVTRMCRFDRRAVDSKCDGCPRTTDKDYLISLNLWVEGVSHGQRPAPE